MRILLITETIPYPLDTGGRIKTFQTLQLLRGHDVQLHAFIRTPEERQHERALRDVCGDVHLHLVGRHVLGELADLGRSVLTGTPFTVTRHWRHGVAKTLAAAAAAFRPDVVYCDHLSTIQYGRPLGLPIFHDAHNVEFALVRRFADANRGTPKGLVAAREWPALRRYESAAYLECDVISAVSPEDAAVIADMAGGRPVHVIPIAFDTDRVAPRRPGPRPPHALFVGGLHWPPNEDGVRHFGREIWPLVLAGRADATCEIVGRASDAQRAAYASASLSVAGYVEDVAPRFEAARVFVVPLRAGGGMRVKILEAFARGVPVVSTRVGAEGIDGVDGEHFLLADAPDRFAAAVLAVLQDDGLADRLAAAGRALLESRYSLSAISGVLQKALAEATPDGR